jgi:uncharacterized phage protein gp47/JayE
MAIRTKSQVIADAISFIANAIPNIATFVGSVVRDLVIESPAEEFENVYEELARTQKLQSVAFAEEQTLEELDALAANYGITRLTGTAATGFVTFRVRNFSVSSSNISIPTGTVVGTSSASDTPQITFTTTQSLLFDASVAPSYFNPATGFYELSASLVSESIGEAGNVAAGSLIELISSIPGVFSVVNNSATTGGTDVESNTDLAARIQIALTGNSVGTPAGIVSQAQENANVVDALVVTPNDPEMIRDEFGGEVDVYIIGEVLDTAQDTVLYRVDGPQEFVMAHQPAKGPSGITVTGFVGAAPYTFIQDIGGGGDYQFIENTSTLFNGSTRLQNKIRFKGSPDVVPDDETAITITYTYNSLIEDLQLSYNQLDAHIVTTDILVKEATKALIGVTADISLFPGYIAVGVSNAVKTALTNYINALGLGDSIDRSDIIGVIEDIEGVDSVNVNTLVLLKDSVPIPAATQRLQITKTEYPRASESELIINIV